MKAAVLPEKLASRADEVRATVAQNLSDLFLAQRWSRRAAAQHLGLSHTYVNSRVAGDIECSASDLAMFAAFLDVPITKFYEPVGKVAGGIAVIGPRSGSGAGRRNVFLLDEWARRGSNPRPAD